MVLHLRPSALPPWCTSGRDDAKEIGEGAVGPCLACEVCSGLLVWLGPSGFQKPSNNETLPQIAAQ